MNKNINSSDSSVKGHEDTKQRKCDPETSKPYLQANIWGTHCSKNLLDHHIGCNIINAYKIEVLSIFRLKVEAEMQKQIHVGNETVLITKLYLNELGN